MPSSILPADRPRGHGPFELTPTVLEKLDEEWELVEQHFEQHAEEKDSARVTLRLRRKSRYYVMRMIVPSGVCASLSMTAWNLSNAEFEGRAAILVTLFLALVASGNTYTALLPRVPYLTALDRYMTACMAFCTLVLLGSVLGSPHSSRHAFLGARGGPAGNGTAAAIAEGDAEPALTQLWESIDFCCIIVLSVGWLLYHVHFYCTFVLVPARKRHKERKSMSEARIALEAKTEPAEQASKMMMSEPAEKGKMMSGRF